VQYGYQNEMKINHVNEIPDGGSLRLQNARVPSLLLDTDLAIPDIDADGLVLVDIDIADGSIEAIHLVSDSSRPGHDDGGQYRSVDLDQGQVWPCYVDVHTHLDKSHISGRTLNPDGSLLAAIRAEAIDQSDYWSEDDLRKRMSFALQCAYAHGTQAIRSHLCSEEPIRDKIWRVFAELRAEWSGKIFLQPASIVDIDLCDGPYAERLANFVADRDGVLGCAILDAENPQIPSSLDHIMRLATERSLDLDFHADENGNPDSHGLRQIAQAVLRNDFSGKVLVGHCCSLAQQHPDDIDSTLNLVANCNISIVSLPSTNMYLQDRRPGTTPRWRGITCLQEMEERSIPVALANDNCRDLFNFHGDYDMHKVFADSVLAGHLDMCVGSWPGAVTAIPSEIMRLAESAVVRVGNAADLVVFSARTFGELLARPQSDRIVLRRGQPTGSPPPDYRLLDA
jgi:cytosine/creatinine deaminase